MKVSSILKEIKKINEESKDQLYDYPRTNNIDYIVCLFDNGVKGIIHVDWVDSNKKEFYKLIEIIE